MSHPKSGSITVTHDDLLRETERRKRQKECQAKEKREAVARNLARREAERQRAAEVAAARVKRRIELEKRHEESPLRADKDRLQR